MQGRAITSGGRGQLFRLRIAAIGGGAITRGVVFMLTMAELARRLCGQYLLVPGGHSVSLPTWQARQLGDWVLHVKQPLPVTDIVDEQDRVIGVVLGHALDESLGLPPDVLRLPVSAANEPATQSAMERWCCAAGGRYLAILLQPRARIYPDAGAFLPAYRCGRSGAVSSSPQLAALVAGPAPSEAKHEQMRTAMDIPHKSSWYPFGLTPCPSVARLLPNHCLDLHTGVFSRYWLPASKRIKLAECAAVVADMLRKQTGRILADGPGYLSLTAGHDSRLILSSCREHLHRLVCYTVDSDAVDVHTAKQLTTYVGAAHFVQTRHRGRRVDLETWLQRTGYCIARAGTNGLLRRPPLDPDRAVLGGFGGELCRGFYWHRIATQDTALDPDKLIATFGLPSSPLLQEAADHWLCGTPRNLSTLDVLDLAYIEQRLGCWAAPQQLAEPFVRGRFHPLVHHRIFEAMLSLPVEQRGTHELSEAVIERLWPSLLQIPFNPEPSTAPLRVLAKQAFRQLPAPLRRPIERGWKLATRLR